MKPLSVYIHVPFCKAKCFYCDFPSYSGKEKLIVPYIYALENEIKEESINYTDYVVETVFFGGGTPSYIGSALLISVLKIVKANFNTSKHCEISVEANPATVDLKSLKQLKQAGFNRISFGAQSHQNEILHKLNRIHTAECFVENFHQAREAGFKNINVDLMFALPGQSAGMWKETLYKTAVLLPEHISCYSLTVEEGTVLHKCLLRGEYGPTEDETDRIMYYDAKHILKQSGYNQYEISNFSFVGRECRHNLTYWELKEYAGFGVSSHSYIDRRRFYNVSDLNVYINRNGRNIIQEEKTISLSETIAEFMFLGLRKTAGIKKTDFYEKFGDHMENFYLKELKQLIHEGLLIQKYGRIFLSDKGMDVANYVFEKFL